VTEDKQEFAEQEIARLRRELEAVQKKIPILGSATRHDINNQLTVILGYNDLLLATVEDEKVRQYLLKSSLAARKISRIVAYSKVFGAIGAEPPRWQSLDTIVHRAADEADPGALRIQLDVKSYSLYADPQVSKAFSFLFNNAAQHGKHATVIRVSLLQPESAPVLVIEDDGAGIPPEKKDRIFDRGYGTLTGWGLFVAREILLETGMTIRENGLPGAGARFEIAIQPGHIRAAGQNLS